MNTKALFSGLALVLGMATLAATGQGTYIRSYDTNRNNVIDEMDSPLRAATDAAYYANNQGARRWTATPTKTATRTPTATSTATPVPTKTSTPTNTPTIVPTEVPVVTVTPTPGSLAGLPCPASVHDLYVVTGPDGNTYPTWHPIIDTSTLCVFTHEHGDNPATSLADNSMPPFGYIGALAGHSEPHNGFKVKVLNIGDDNPGESAGPALFSARGVFHMGTSGANRFVERFHSLEYDVIFPDGREFHVQGMADTGGAGHICERDGLNSNSNPDDDIGRTVVVLAGQGCDRALVSNYEIWAFNLRIGIDAGDGGSSILSITPALAVFDPASFMDKSVSPPAAVLNGQRGCRGDFYMGPHHLRNSFTGQSVFFTDAFGNLGGTLRQEISQGTNIDGGQFKQVYNNCYPQLTLPN